MMTVTLMLWVPVASSVSVAVTVIVAVPVASDVISTLPPDAVAVATPVLEEAAEKVRVSPLGSEKYLGTVTDLEAPFLGIEILFMVPTGRGG